MRPLATICFILLSAGSGLTQQTTGATEQQLEALSEVLEESEIEDDTYLQQLVYFQRHRININAVGAEDLQVFRLLTPLQIQSLLAYRNLLGPFIDLHELQAVPHWDVETIRKMLPYIRVDRKEEAPLINRLTAGEHQFLVRHSRLLQRQRGYDKSLANRYAGSRDKLLLRYIYQFQNILQYGLTVEKDAGETALKMFKNPFDFASVHLFMRYRGIVKAVAIGDYTVNLGQGLVQWQALAFGKSSEVTSIVRQSAVIRPYSGAGEFYFNRGVAATLQKNRWEATVFASRRRLTANLQLDSVGSASVTSFNTAGLHRTRGEMAERKNVVQWSYGGKLSYKTPVFKMGINAVQHHFSIPLQKQPELHNLFAIQGRQWANASIDYTYTFKNLYLFGEAATDQKGFKAFLQGALASLHPHVDVALLYRNLSPAYQTLYGHAFTESALPTNEKGFYAGITIRPHPAWRLQAYADQYRFPWVRATIAAPGGGADYLLQANYTPNKKVEAYLRLRIETKDASKPGADGIMNAVQAIPKQNIRLHLSYKINPPLTIRSRVEMVWYDRGGGLRRSLFNVCRRYVQALG